MVKFFLMLLFLKLSYASDVIKSSCIGCHGKASEVAPTFEEIYDVYSNKNKNPESLYKSFLTNPSKKNALLKDSVKKYGVMPKIHLSSQELDEVSKFLAKGYYKNIYLGFKTDFKEPFEKGLSITKAIKSELGKNLLKAIKENKTVGAISFCNEKALTITKKVEHKFNTKIKRATDKPRNPKNLASKDELKYIELFKEQLKIGMPKPIIVSKDNQHTFYAPIVTNEMCLQCHGEKDINIKPDVFKRINKLYPKDYAKGYKSNELRGIFSIKWQSNK